VEKLHELWAIVTVADFGSGKLDNLRVCKDRIDIHRVNVREHSEARATIPERAFVYASSSSSPDKKKGRI
jgi:hypothetical protein